MKYFIYQIIENILLPSIKLWGVDLFFDAIQFKALKKNHPLFEEEAKVNSQILELIDDFNTDLFC